MTIKFREKSGRKSIIEKFYGIGAKSPYYEGHMEEKYNELYKAVEKGTFYKIKNIINQGFDIEGYETKFGLKITGETLLTLACQKGNIEIINLLIKSGMDINRKNSDGESPLMVTIKNINSNNDYFNIASMLIEEGADVNTQDNEGETPLMCCFDMNVIELLLQNGADLNIRNKQGDNILIMNCRTDNSPRITEKNKLYLEMDIDVNVQGEFKRTALMWSIIEKSDDFKLLIEHGADITLVDRFGNTALDYARRYNREEVVEYLLKQM